MPTITNLFTLKYTFNKSDIKILSQYNIINSKSYTVSDSIRAVKYFNLRYDIIPAKEVIKQFSLVFKIKNEINSYLFKFPFIFNKEKRVSVKYFTLKAKIETLIPYKKVFYFKHKIEISNNYKVYNFYLPYKTTKTNYKILNYNFRFKLTKGILSTILINFPFKLDSGNNNHPSQIDIIPFNSSLDIIEYYCDGLTLNIGDISDLLASEIQTPRVIYIIVLNGSYNPFRIGRFEIKESTKNIIQIDNGIELSLQGDNVKIKTYIDKKSPFSIKSIRGNI